MNEVSIGMQATGPNDAVKRAFPGWALPMRPRPVEWAYLLGGLFLSMAYFWIMDDAFVYFRYVDNLVFLNRGLVFNPGEYVEGYSSPAWALMLILARLAGLNYLGVIQVATGASFLAFGFLLVQLNRRLAPPDTPIVNFPLAYLAFNYGVLCYFSSGMESPALQVLAVAYALFFLNPKSAALQAAIGVSPLIRQELMLPLLLAVAWGWWRTRRLPWTLLATAAATLGGWILFRVYYYADLLPNTFYLKDMVDFQRGLVYLWDTVSTYHVIGAFTIIALLGFLAKRRGSADAASDDVASALALPERAVMLAAAGIVTLYVVKIGGDARHYRYLAFPLILAACATAGVCEHFAAACLSPQLQRLLPWSGLLVALSIFACVPPQLNRHPLFLEEDAALYNQISDAQTHRFWPMLHYTYWAKAANPQTLRHYEITHRGIPPSHCLVTFWCVNAYCAYDKRVIQSLGLTDPFLARTHMPVVRTAHKFGLGPMARDIARIERAAPALRPGIFRTALHDGRAPEWVARNIDTIDLIERKVFNQHRFCQNLALALQFPPPIQPYGVPQTTRPIPDIQDPPQ